MAPGHTAHTKHYHMSQRQLDKIFPAMRRAVLDPCAAPPVKTKQQRFCKTKSVWFTAERQQLLSNLQMHLLSTEHK